MYKKILIVLVFILGLSFSLQAQEDTSMAGPRKELHKAVKEKFMEKLSIDESTANKFFTLYGEQRKLISGYNREKKDIMKNLEDNPDASDVMTKLNQLLEIDDKITKAKKDFISDLQKFLTPKQIAQTITFQKNLKKMFSKRKDRH